jgi:hypothetical protein
MTKKRPAKVIPLTPRRRKVIDLTRFIDAHGGKLGAYHPPGSHHQPGTRCRYCGYVAPGNTNGPGDALPEPLPS